MPIKFGEIDNAQLYVMQDGEYKPLGHISEVELTSEPVNPTPDQEYHAYFSPEPIELEGKILCNPKAFYIFITTGNDLYLRFPKKLRRKKFDYYTKKGII